MKSLLKLSDRAADHCIAVGNEIEVNMRPGGIYHGAGHGMRSSGIAREVTGIRASELGVSCDKPNPLCAHFLLGSSGALRSMNNMMPGMMANGVAPVSSVGTVTSVGRMRCDGFCC